METDTQRELLKRVGRNGVVFPILVAALSSLAFCGTVSAQEAKFTVGGEGAVGKDSVVVGAPFELQLNLSNTVKQNGYTLGFVFNGKSGLKNITHLTPDSAESTSDNVVFLNGFEGKGIWDMGGPQKRAQSWDGELPDSLLIGGVGMNKGWPKSDLTHYVSILMKANGVGQLCIDSVYIDPGGDWLYVPGPVPVWAGEYCVTVVPAKEAKEAKADSSENVADSLK